MPGIAMCVLGTAEALSPIMSWSAGAHVHASQHHSRDFGWLRPSGICLGHEAQPTLGTRLSDDSSADANITCGEEAHPRVVAP
eukprot:3230574-Heterocapsa_arctica.AAC.1